MVILVACSMFFAFKEKTNNFAKEPLVSKTLYFKYQLNSYTEPEVTSQANWELIDPEEACEHEQDEKACSFSIEIPADDEALFLDGSHPSSRVLIEANASGLNHFVSDVKEDVPNGKTIVATIENIRN